MNQSAFTCSDLELWGGVECTVNRVGDTFFDQLERSGHARRIGDLDRFAELGISAIRYPILWERTAPAGIARADWTWPDQRLQRLRQLGITPIVGLVHHGSGPRGTSLIDPAFADNLAAYARAVAERYPWVTHYTPVNEPLTTARFCGLYGHWYPHGRDDLSFGRALLNQVRAVALAMQAIREVNPQAQLIQTDDLGKTWSTPALEYQARFENTRRWATFDLLCGRVTSEHPLWSYLIWAGLTEREIAWFEEHPCPPDIIGINHYLSGERFLDDRVELYPEVESGGNGRDRYVDVLAARVLADGAAGPQALLEEAWARYGLPLAITEAHNGCTREEQLRWLAEIWDAACSLRNANVDVRAVTVWSLLGCYDWNHLVTRSTGHYEPGVFDLRGPQPRPTALVKLMQNIAARRNLDDPTLHAPGWWRRPERLSYGFALSRDGQLQPAPPPQPMRDVSPTQVRPIVITGATGTLGQAVARLCELRGLPYRLLTRRELDITQPASIGAALNEYRPWAVINAAGYVRVDEAEHDWSRCYRENADGPALLAASCAWRGIRFVTFSSDLVFDGAQTGPYVESDRVAPLNVYGRSKVEAEARVLAAHPGALLVRTSAFFGPWDRFNFVTNALDKLAAGVPVVAADDTTVSPTYVPDLVHACLDLLIDGETGIWHLANIGSVTWVDLAHAAATRAGFDPTRIVGRPTAELGFAAARPRFSVLGSERGVLLPSLDDALDRYIRERGAARTIREPSVQAVEAVVVSVAG